MSIINIIIEWLINNWFELIAATLGIIGVFLQIKQNFWYWALSIIMVIMYIFVFYETKFYADMSFQFYYLIMGIYGLYYWKKNRTLTTNNDKATTIIAKKLSLKQLSISIILAAIFFSIIYFILYNYTDSEVPIGDAFTTSLSYIATWLLVKKYIENWIFWIVINVVSASLYIYKDLYPTSILFIILTILAFVGYYKWKKHLINEKNI